MYRKNPAKQEAYKIIKDSEFPINKHKIEFKITLECKISKNYTQVLLKDLIETGVLKRLWVNSEWFLIKGNNY